MAKVWSIVVWLYPNDHLTEEDRQQRRVPERPRGWRVGVFNPPAVDRLPYGHYDSLKDAEQALAEIEARLEAGRPLRVTLREHTFLIPAHSVQYVALGEGEAGTES
ncbi:hypothetical protein [Marinithermus hydrothermalis]|uniref:Uncharacterized protein n=1 Tax=Marinithermus hydrothermalis (strain DSM 14884 / JCM 11576 / T1) TaxID=869210 RepID=F2NNU5_MARHT|nr:hypothetical protein [Marinithermus hydrothermalis]AEB11319.1 hypothetical protein Marky_0568 [Marinithermus hydrothermalis DSM 14884]